MTRIPLATKAELDALLTAGAIPATPTVRGGMRLAGDLARFDSSPDAPHVGKIAQWVAQPVYVKPLRMAIFGASIANANDHYPDNWPTNNPTGASTMVVAKAGYGYVNCANMLLGQRLRIVHKATVAGTSSAVILARIQDPADPYYLGNVAEPDVYLVSDIPAADSAYSISYADSIANMEAIHNVIRSFWPNAIGIGTTIPGVTVTLDNAAMRLAINPALRAFYAANRIRLFDMEQIFTDRATGLPPAGEVLDTPPAFTHPNYKGCLGRISKELARLLWPLVPQGDMLVTDYLQDPRVQAAAGGWGTAALFLGTGGTMFRDLNTRSTIAAGWTVDIGAGVSGGDTALVADEKFGSRQFVRIPPGLAAPTGVGVSRSSTGPGGAGFPAGAIVGGEVEIVYHGDLENLTDMGLLVKGASATQYAQDGIVFGTNGGPPVDPGPGVPLTFQCKPMKLTSPEASFIFNVNVTAQAGSFEVRRASLVIG
jgi:hypothetical protein